ncbi:MAG: DUF1501 domain-containing protein [Planctomycetia bacterium]|nr:DUF1501 domain-containing protein [Planctomycetia bacterium]
MRRRNFLGLGLTGGLSGLLGSTSVLRASDSTKARAKQVIIVFEQGGMSHIDTWDPKPETIAEHRSPYQPIDTNVSGIQFTSLLPNVARHADKLAIVRSMCHTINDHGAGAKYVLQGVKPGGAVEMPDLGAAVAQRIGTVAKHLPPYVMIPGNGEMSGYAPTTGFLSPAWKAFRTQGRDLSQPGWKVADLGLIGGLDDRRFKNRRDLLSNLDVGLLSSGNPTDVSKSREMTGFFEHAFDMLSNPRTQNAFDLTQESAATREQYGIGHRGQCYLLARRLVESGVRVVALEVRENESPTTPGGFNMNWDHHDEIYTSGSCGTVRNKAGGEGRYGIGHWVMTGSTDQAFAALLADLHERGLLSETLVCFVTEFGRTPKLNKFQGRDHWSNAFSIAFAGAGVRGGQVIGKSDKDGGYVLDQLYTLDDYAATVIEFLGIDRETPTYTRENRPVFLVPEGRAIERLV